MKNLDFYEDFEEYKASLFARFDRSFVENDFYRNMILFVADHRSPTYYDISDPDEHFAFSGAYHFMTKREYDGDTARQSIFQIHDLTHLLFPYAHNAESVSLQQFTDAFIYQERIASTETEVMSYFRVNGLRKRVFQQDRILFDAIEDKPDPAEFLVHRSRIILDDAYGQQHLGEYPDVLKWMRSWRRLTPSWCEKRYQSTLGKNVPSFEWLTLTVENYEQVIGDYVHQPSQQRYERNVLRNLAMAYALLGWSDAPTDFCDAERAFQRLEGAVLVR